MALQKLQTLKPIQSLDLGGSFLPTGGGGGIGGGGFPTGGPIVTGFPPIGGGGGGTVTPVGVSLPTGPLQGAQLGWNLLNLFSGGAGTSMLTRIVMLIIGLLCIIGAIYLYKPTTEFVAAPVRAAHGAVRDAAFAAEV